MKQIKNLEDLTGKTISRVYEPAKYKHKLGNMFFIFFTDDTFAIIETEYSAWIALDKHDYNITPSRYNYRILKAIREFEEELVNGELANSYDNVEEFMKALNS